MRRKKEAHRRPNTAGSTLNNKNDKNTKWVGEKQYTLVLKWVEPTDVIVSQKYTIK